MKKLLATLLALATLSTFAFATDEVEETAEVTEEVIEEVVETEEVTEEEVTEEATEEATEEVTEEATEEATEEVTEEVTEEATEALHPFTDVEADAYYESAVIWALENGITTGVTETTFEPASTCTRGQVVTFLWRAMGEPEAATTENPFTDVDESSAFYTAILWAVGEGITTGVTETTFEPSTTCSSAQVVTFLYRAMGEPEATEESELSADVADAYVAPINWAAAIGLLDGIEFVAADASPRADIVTYLYLIDAAVEVA